MLKNDRDVRSTGDCILAVSQTGSSLDSPLAGTAHGGGSIRGVCGPNCVLIQLFPWCCCCKEEAAREIIFSLLKLQLDSHSDNSTKDPLPSPEDKAWRAVLLFVSSMSTSCCCCCNIEFGSIFPTENCSVLLVDGLAVDRCLGRLGGSLEQDSERQEEWLTDLLEREGSWGMCERGMEPHSDTSTVILTLVAVIVYYSYRLRTALWNGTNLLVNFHVFKILLYYVICRFLQTRDFLHRIRYWWKFLVFNFKRDFAVWVCNTRRILCFSTEANFISTKILVRYSCSETTVLASQRKSLIQYFATIQKGCSSRLVLKFKKK
jgi:hypothetical protein